jgi:hypothetical protein
VYILKCKYPEKAKLLALCANVLNATGSWLEQASGLE